MFGSPLLDVAIGLIFFYLALSLLCTTLTELVSFRMKKRARFLERGLLSLLRDPNGELVGRLLAHPLVSPGGTQDKPAHIDPSYFALALLDVLNGDRPPATAAELAASVQALPNQALGRALTAILAAEGYTLASARNGVARWFETGMDQVSGWYKLNMQVWTLGSAMTVVLLLNADTLLVVETLWKDKTLRDSVVAAASNQVQAGAPLPAKPSMPAEPSGPAQPATEKELVERIQGLQEQVAPFPLGWARDAQDPRSLPGTWSKFLGKLLGLTLTSIAISLGAPFWFDVLKKLINLRPKVAQEEEERKKQ